MVLEAPGWEKNRVDKRIIPDLRGVVTIREGEGIVCESHGARFTVYGEEGGEGCKCVERVVGIAVVVAGAFDVVD